MTINEEKYREEIRRKLEEEERAKQERFKQTSPEKEDPQKRKSPLSQEIKDYIYLEEGLQYYKSHDNILICSNHLGEFMFCAPNILEMQNEFFDEGKDGEKRLQKILKNKPKFDFSGSAAITYREEVKERFLREYKLWEEHSEKLAVKLQERERNRLKQKIHEEEKEKFYQSRPEYKKFYNHLGEYKWLTEEEFHQQNEYYPPEESVPDKIARNYKLWFAASVIILFFVATLFWSFWPEKKKYAYIDIKSNIENFRLLANGANFLVDNYEKLIKIPLQDSQKVKVRAFKPNFKLIEGDTTLLLAIGDTAKYLVRMRKVKLTDHLVKVKLSANIENAKVFVNRSYLGEFPEISQLDLEKGIYDIQLFKKNYRSVTGTVTLDLSADTTSKKVYFEFEPVSKIIESRQRNIRGSLAISSDVPNARVFINGEYKGLTNLVLDNLSTGKYEIRLEKKGYKIIPARQVVELGPGNEIATIEFTLINTSGQLNIEVIPRQATIFMDGKKLTTGSFKGLIPVGKHLIIPANVDGYRTPKSFEIDVKQNDYQKISIIYSPNIDYRVSLNADGQIQKKGDIRVFPGYLRLGVFRENKDTGPELTKNDKAGFGWMMGYALRFETPPGEDGFTFIIDIPISFDLKLPVFFYWEGYKINENYPFTPVENHKLKLTINGKEVFDEYAPRYSIDKYPGTEEKVQINSYLRPGNNRLQFSVAKDNTSFYFLKKVRIH